MHLYRVVIDAYDSRSYTKRGARIVVYVRAYDRRDLWQRMGYGTPMIAPDGRVWIGDVTADRGRWPGLLRLAADGVTGPHAARGLPEYTVHSVRAVARPAAGGSRVLFERESAADRTARERREDAEYSAARVHAAA